MNALKRFILMALLVGMLTGGGFAAMTNSVNDYTQPNTWWWSDSATANPLFKFVQEVEDIIEDLSLESGYVTMTNGLKLDNETDTVLTITEDNGAEDESLLLTFTANTITASSTTGVDLFSFGTIVVDLDKFKSAAVTYTLPTVDGTAGQVLVTNASGVLTWAANGGGVTSLDTAYNGGATIDVDGDAVTLTTSDTDNNVVLSIVQNDSTNDNTAMTIASAADLANAISLDIDSQATGRDIEGTGASWYVTGAGAMTVDSITAGTGTFTTLYKSAVVAAAAGNVGLTVDAAGNGTITLGGTSTGLITTDNQVQLLGITDIGDVLASDTLSIVAKIDTDVYLDDDTTDSPALILRDAGEATATFVKANGATGDTLVTIAAASDFEIVAGNLAVGDGSPGTAAMDGEDFYVNGDSEFDGSVQFDGAVTSAAGITATGGTINLNASSNNAVNIGTGTTTSTVTIGGAGNQTINIGDGAAVKAVTLGSSNTTSTTTLLSGSNAINLNASNNQPTNINTGTSTGTVTIGGTGIMAVDIGTGGTGAKTISIGDGASTGATALKSGSGGLGLNVSTNHPVNIGTGTTTGTVTIGGDGIQAIDIGNGAAAKTVALGSSNTTSTTTILSGSGSINLNVSNNAPVNIGTGTTTGTVTIGGAGIQAIDIGNGAAAKTVALGSANTTSTTTISAGSGGIVLVGAVASGGSITGDGGDTLSGFKKTVVDDTDHETLDATDSGGVFTNAGAGGQQTYTLPAAAAGIEYTFVVMAAQELRVLGVGDDVINIGQVAGSAAEYVTANAVGESMTIVAVDATNWIAVGEEGTWTHQP